MTTPAAAAMIGVPYGTPMSMPSCMRPQRQPNGLVTGPFTGQISPEADGVPGDGAHRHRALPGGRHVRPGRRDGVRDPLVLVADLADVGECVEEVGEARDR